MTDPCELTDQMKDWLQTLHAQAHLPTRTYEGALRAILEYGHRCYMSGFGEGQEHGYHLAERHLDALS